MTATTQFTNGFCNTNPFTNTGQWTTLTGTPINTAANNWYTTPQQPTAAWVNTPAGPVLAIFPTFQPTLTNTLNTHTPWTTQNQTIPTNGQTNPFTTNAVFTTPNTTPWFNTTNPFTTPFNTTTFPTAIFTNQAAPYAGFNTTPSFNTTNPFTSINTLPTNTTPWHTILNTFTNTNPFVNSNPFLNTNPFLNSNPFTAAINPFAFLANTFTNPFSAFLPTPANIFPTGAINPWSVFNPFAWNPFTPAQNTVPQTINGAPVNGNYAAFATTPAPFPVNIDGGEKCSKRSGTLARDAA